MIHTFASKHQHPSAIPTCIHRRASLLLLSSFAMLVLGMGCAHNVRAPEMPVEYQKFTDEISVQSALYLAESSYTLGCTEASRAGGRTEGIFQECRELARKSVKENVIRVLEDAPTDPAPTRQ